MAVEAQRVIAVSLGKIANSRQKRTGVDLHKNLLVSTVLQKARSQFMIETYRAAVQAQQLKDVVKYTPPVVEEEQSVDMQHQNEDIYEDKENAPPVFDSDSDSDECGDDDCFEPAGEYDEEDDSVVPRSYLQDNTLEEKDVNILEIGALPTCGKCVKRRHVDTVLYDDCGNGVEDDTENIVPVKKSKSIHNEAIISDNDNSPKEYTELEVPQLSSLVTIFNSGFTGLVNNIGGQNNEQSLSTSKNNSSCSMISIRNTFDSITRPILAVAMSV